VILRYLLEAGRGDFACRAHPQIKQVLAVDCQLSTVYLTTVANLAC